MKIYNGTGNFKAINPVVTIGIFDGVHLGHKQLLKRIKEVAQQISGETVVLTLWPHPRLVLGKNNQFQLLSTLEEKINLIKNEGIDHLVIFPFDLRFAAITYEMFIEEYFVKAVKAAHIVIGFNHRFGKDRNGGFEQLKERSATFGYSVERLDQIVVEGYTVSSSEIRNLISNGNIDAANRLLGYKYPFEGSVVEGKKLGRQLGYPTANIQAKSENKLVPAKGVYAAFIEIEGLLYKGMLNIGYRPTIARQVHRLTIEMHIFNFNQNIYGKDVKILFVEKLRDEKKFQNADELKWQLMKDKKTSISVFEKHAL
ncbi:MAG: bifunctional riboflavin kinase/FAD synthetase [Bacteroidales bacterium]|nr:bifunctional riboflavin kinase/FAD synthetase [Bacteroidales bacterium]